MDPPDRDPGAVRLKNRLAADYVRAELQKLGLTDIRTDEMLNVSGVRKGMGRRAVSCICRASRHRISRGHGRESKA